MDVSDFEENHDDSSKAKGSWGYHITALCGSEVNMLWHNTDNKNVSEELDTN